MNTTMRRSEPICSEHPILFFFALALCFSLLQTPALAQINPATLPDLNLSNPGLVRSLAVQEDGKVIIAGGFDHVDDLPRWSPVRLNPNGSVDRGWSPPGILSSNAIRALALSSTHVYVAGGPLTPLNTGLARFNRVNGALDDTWTNNVHGIVECLASDGSYLYFGGSFDQVSGISWSNLARVSLAGSGSLDTNWTVTADAAVQRLALDGAALYVAGRFLLPRPGLAKISTVSGMLDTNWSPVLPGTVNFTALAIGGTNVYTAYDSTNGALLKLNPTSGARDTNWNPLAAGNSNLALTVTASNVFIGGISNGLTVLFKADANGLGTLDSTWNANARLNDSANEGAEICALATTVGSLYVGGSFIASGGSISLGITKLDLVSGLRRSEFVAHAQIPGKVNAITRQSDGKLIIGGKFQVAGGLARRNIARLSLDNQLDSNWAPDVNGEVFALALSGTNVFVGGQFSKAGGLGRTNLAKISIGNSDGTDDAWNAGISNTFGVVKALAVGGPNLFVGGGRFGMIGGQSRSGLAKLNIASPAVAETSWNPNPLWPAQTNIGVNALVVSSNELIVGGYFFNIATAPRRALAKLSVAGGTNVSGWNQNLRPDLDGTSVSALALDMDRANVFVAGSFTNIAGFVTNAVGQTNLFKLAVAGQADSNWNAGATSETVIKALDVDGLDLLVGGYFNSFAGQSRTNLARLTTTNGALDNAFSPNPDGGVLAVLAEPDRDVIVGGEFADIGQASRSALAFMTRAAAPVFIQDTTTNLYLTRNPADSSEVTHFQITQISNGTLYLSDGITIVTQGTFLTVTQGEAGLKFLPGVGGTLKAVSAVNPGLLGRGTAEATLTMTNNPAPVLKFDPDTYSVREGDGNVIINIRKYGTGATNVSYTTTGQSALPNVDFQSKNGSLSFSSNDITKNVVIKIADDLFTQGDRIFLLIITNGPVAGSRSAYITIVDNDILGDSESVTTTRLPDAPPLSSGVLMVSLAPTNGLWRLKGELNWHTNGAAISGLVTNNYAIEFQPIFGYYAPDDVTVPISAGITNVFSFSYSQAGSNYGVGNLSMTIEPSEVATNTDLLYRGQWRRKYYETNWHDSGYVVANLAEGYYTVEFKAVSNRSTPSEQVIEVGANATYGAAASYLYAVNSGGQPAMAVVPFSTATTTEPYVYNGQLQTSVGFSSAFVVKSNVILTVAHALFDDVSLAYAAEARWFFQRYRDQLEPAPLVPRGWYISDSYSSQRAVDNSPGISTPESQQLDAAAIYFLENAGRGGYGGYLSSDAANNEFLLSSNDKFLAGYPLDGVLETNQGKLHASTNMNLVFTHLTNSIFSTTGVESYPGNSGGPLYVLNLVNTVYRYLPAGVYLGGSGQTLIRAIDSTVVDLINRAEQSGNGGGNSTGGGPVKISYGSCDGCSLTLCGKLTVNLIGATGQASWRFPNYTNAYTSGCGSTHAEGTGYVSDRTRTVTVAAQDNFYNIEFKAVAGYTTPSNVTVSVKVSGQTTVDATYLLSPPTLLFDSSGNIGIALQSSDTVQIQYTDLLPATDWLLLTNVTLSAGTNWIPLPMSSEANARFYRTFWYPK